MILLRLALALIGIELRRDARRAMKRMSDALAPEEEPFPLCGRRRAPRATILPPKPETKR